ncbi:D-2-hydroxyacid dehydrogenase family protein [Actinopolyspora saharensis]|uniref:Lactate dehydrogenase n=1 Tax=Actinopolyspora saharensis TaxID=995062 RepID=A0A1H0Y1W8_9ACTN|nr:D-2-hydroxyacid dehydrogenase family protein [Actinopolyspora saharensis]SDQ09051.1 Lactate dehydrogenase [Actinopolyspora saharensis]
MPGESAQGPGEAVQRDAAHASDAAGVAVAVLDDYQNVARDYGDWESLPAGTEVVVFDEHIADSDELVRRLARFDVVAAMRERTAFPREVLEALPRLRLLVTTGMGNAAIDMQAAAENGVTVCGTGNGSAAGDDWAPTAELTWGLILALARGIPREDRAVRTGGWQHTIGVDLGGRTLGVLGLGRLGGQVATVGRAFGMEVLAFSENLTQERASEFGARAVGKRELFTASDVVTIHMRLSERSRGLVGRAEIDALGPEGYLINTSRGPIVDELELIAALHEGRVGGAGIDVYGCEPLPADDPWRSAPRTVLTPHIGYVSETTYRAFYTETVEDIRRFLQGSPVRVLNGG